MGITAASVLAFVVGLLVSVVAYTPDDGEPSAGAGTAIDRAADAYVALARALADRDPLSGDEQSTAATSPATGLNGHRLTFKEIAAQATDAGSVLEAFAPADPRSTTRRRELQRDLHAIAVRASLLDGRTLTLDQELQGLFSVSRSSLTGAPATDVHARLDALLPGRGSLLERFTRFEEGFQVPADRLPAVFARALTACRARTLAHVALPPTESITVDYVKGAPWSGYSTYLGNDRSLIQVNTQFPQSVDRLLDLACHEGYPGHHTSSLLRDQQRHHGLDWPERSIMPTFTPYAFAAEAAASQAAALAFGEADRVDLEGRELFPIAGIEPGEAARYVRVMRLVAQLDGSIANAIQGYLTGELDFPDAVSRLEADALMAHPEALMMFVNRYRGYALAYVSGTTTVDRALRAGASEDELWSKVVAPFERP